MNGACRENWNAMHPTTEGRFCGKCQHAVMDFSGWDRSAVVAYKLAHPDACGVYLPEHLEPGLIHLADLLGAKRGLLAAGLTLGAITVQAQAAPQPSTEQTVPNDRMPSFPDIAPENRPLKPMPGMDSPAFAGVCYPNDRPLPKAKAHRFHRVYVSNRFPFIHFRRPYVMGRFL